MCIMMLTQIMIRAHLTTTRERKDQLEQLSSRAQDLHASAVKNAALSSRLEQVEMKALDLEERLARSVRSLTPSLFGLGCRPGLCW